MSLVSDDEAIKGAFAAKGYKAAYNLTKEQEKHFGEINKKLFGDRDKGLPPHLHLGGITFNQDQIKALTSNTSYITRCEVYARAEQGINTSVTQMHEMETLAERIRTSNQDLGTMHTRPAKAQTEKGHVGGRS